MSYSTLNFDTIQGKMPPNLMDTTGVPQSYYHNVYYLFFSAKNIAFIRDEITNRLTGVHPEGKNIIVPDDTIVSVMDSIYDKNFHDVDKLTMMTIQFITDHIRNEFQVELQNSRLSAWIQYYPSDSGIRQYPPIKLRERAVSTYTTQWNY
jgi:hypothetical protein